MTRLLFLCTGNSCRSQMAEGWARHLGPEWLAADSAGIEAHGINPHAIDVMGEAGIDISRQESREVSDEMLAWADIVVTVCDHAESRCPVLPASTRKVHWSLRDPARAGGSAEEILAGFRHSRDDIRRRVEDLIQRLERQQHER